MVSLVLWAVFSLKLPFYVLSFTRMGWRFTVDTFLAVTVVSITADHLHNVMRLSDVYPMYAAAALMGGSLVGVSMLMIFRHRMSLGGFNILALFLQEHFGISSGKVQMPLDCSIVVLSLFIVEPYLIILSVSGVVATNLVLTMNHKPGCYQPLGDNK